MHDITDDVIKYTIDCFEELHLTELDETWVSDVILNEFSHFEDCPTPVELLFPDDIMTHLSKIFNICCRWVELQESPNESQHDDTDDSSPVLWKTLVDHGIEIKYVLGIIYLLCTRSVKYSSTLNDKELGLMCGKLYLTMLQTRGSSAYSVYHPGLVRLVISCLKFPKAKAPNKKRQPASAYRNDIISQRKRTHRESSDVVNEPEEHGDNEDSPENEVVETDLTEKECQQLYLKFAELLKHVINFVKTFSLRNDEETLDHIITKLVECGTCERYYTDFDFSKEVDSIFSLNRRYGPAYIVTALAYKALLDVCMPLHGDVDEIFLLVLKHLSMHILCVNAKGQANQGIPHQYLVIKDNAVSFVCYNLEKHPDYSVECARILIQQLSTRVNDKADFRAKVSQAIVTILRYFPVKEFASMNKWLILLANQSKIQERVVALEIFSYLLTEVERDCTEGLPQNLAPYATVVPIAEAIIARCSDKASTVRSKAVNTLANNLEKVIRALSGMDYNRKKRAESESGVSSSSSSLDPDSDMEGEKREQNQVIVDQDQARERLNTLASMICHRTKDFKVHCRKGALQCLEHLMCFDKSYLIDENLDLLYDAVTDPNVTMKKACISSVSAILNKYKTCPKVQSCWLRCVLPLVSDPEKSVQSKSLEVMEIQFLLNINGSDSERKCSWSMLNEVACGEYHNLQRFLTKAFGIWKLEGKLRPGLRTVLEREVGTENNSSAWLLLQLLSVNVELRSTAFIVDYWNNNCDNEDLHPFTKQNVLQVISNTCKHISCERLKSIQDKLENDIQNYRCPVELISVSIEALFKLYEVQSNKTDMYQRLITQFSSETMQASVKYLSGAVKDRSSGTGFYSEDLICQHLFTLGDLALLCPTCIPDRTFFILQSTIVCQIMEPGQSGIASNRGSSSSTRSGILSPKIQAVAFVTLGKLCLQSEEITKICLPTFAHELVKSKHHVIRNNIVIVLADLCIRYTSIVDLYIPSISACLKDKSTLVRHQTFSLLAKLLQEDYIKLKDSLMLRMLSALIDEDKKIRALADYCFGYTMVTRNPSIFLQHIVECVLFFNAHPSIVNTNKYLYFKRDVELFSLTGDRNRSKRMAIYTFMVKNSPPPKRLGIVLKLSQEILGPIADNVIPLDEDGKAVLKDSLCILYSDEIKLPSLHGNSSEDGDEVEIAAEAAVVKSAQRMCLIQGVIPIVISLKKVLQEIKSPLLNDLMIFLREICKDYKTELKELFAGDKQLGKEIEFDIRRYEKECEKENEKRQQAEDTEAGNGDLPITTPARSISLNNREILMQSVERAKSVTKSVTQAQNGTLLHSVRRQNLGRTVASAVGKEHTPVVRMERLTAKSLHHGHPSKAMQPRVLLEKLPSRTSTLSPPPLLPPPPPPNEVRQPGIDKLASTESVSSSFSSSLSSLSSPSCSKEMQPQVVLNKLTSEATDHCLNTASKEHAKNPQHINAQKISTSVKEASVEKDILLSPPGSALSSSSGSSMHPTVRLKLLNRKDLNKAGILASSTPIGEQRKSNFVTIQPDISGLSDSYSSADHNNISSIRRSTRRAKQKNK